MQDKPIGAPFADFYEDLLPLTKDDTLPPDVYKALDAYLAESNSKLLVVLPLKDERESESKRPPRSALMMECFEPNAAPEQLFARLEVIGRHATPALYNAVEHRRIPFRFVWMPLAKIQEGLGGKAKAITLLISTAVIALVLAIPFAVSGRFGGVSGHHWSEPGTASQPSAIP